MYVRESIYLNQLILTLNKIVGNEIINGEN